MISTYKKIFALMDSRERRNFKIISAALVLVSAFEAVGLASIIPFLAVLTEPSMIQQNVYLSTVYERLGFQTDYQFLIFLGFVVLGLVVIGMTLKALTTYALIKFSAQRGYSISMRLVSGYLSQPYAWFLGRDSSDLSKSILSEVQHLTTSVIMPGLKVISLSISATGIVIVVIAVNPAVSIIVASVLCGCYVAVFMVCKKYLTEIGQKRVEANGQRFKVVSEVFGAIKEVKLQNVERVYVNEFHKPASKSAKYLAQSTTIRELPRSIFETIAFGGMIGLILVLMYLESGALSDVLPIIGFYAVAGFRLFPALQQMYASMSQLRFGLPALEEIHRDLQEVRASGEALARTSAASEPLEVRDGVELRGIVFRYPEAAAPALRDTSLRIAANTTVGFVGGTGAGKTTLVDVLLCLLRPEQGTLAVDGQEIDESRIRRWQRAIGYVPQHIFILNDTVAANIAFGIPAEQVDTAAVERAARMAAIHDFVTNELPDGYDTALGEQGVRLSGGQRQRIGIARALYRDPQLLIFDEATSALDNITEKAVMEAMYRLSKQKTIILIAHRLSTVEPCDKIFMFGDGRVLAEGNYQQLIAASPEFRALAGAQSIERSESAVTG
ncbi:ABC transporter ATP-binding protein [Algihabitans albus]|uniref:ABC transporter ATP-binding protein n=1 Tax=Algihabitans albus TaxID=2164067 RepID=UPI0035D06BFD